MRRRTILLVASLVGALALVSVAFASKPPKPPKPNHGHGHHHMFAWHDVATGTTAHFRGLAAVSANKAWVSGYTATGGVVFRTLDRGATWQDVSPAGTPPTLQFRDIEAFDANHAVVMSSGTGPDSQIYRTADGGQTWTLVFQNMEPNAFYRLHDVLQPQGRPGRLRSAGRTEVPDHQDDGRRANVEHRRPGRDASTRCRASSPSQPAGSASRATTVIRPGSAPAEPLRRASSRRGTAAAPGP